MLQQIIELSLRESEQSKDMVRQQELHNQILLEKSKIEAENQIALKKKEEEMDELRKQLAEAQKKQQVNFEKKDDQELVKQKEDLKTAIDNLGSAEAGDSNVKDIIMNKTFFNDGEDAKGRQNKLNEYKDKVQEANKQKMMSFYQIAEEDKHVHEKLEEQRQEEFDKLMKQMDKRKQAKFEKDMRSTQ